MFKELCRITQWTEKLFNSMALAYVKRLYAAFCPNTDNCRYIPNKFLETASAARRIRKNFANRKVLIQFIFSYDLLLYSCT